MSEYETACMSGTMMPTMCQILVVTQLSFKNVYKNCYAVLRSLFYRDAATGFAAVAPRSRVWKTDAVNL